MTLRRATLYVAGGTLLVAWFSSAASMSLGRNSRRTPQVVADSAPAQNLAVSVQTQARRLKERLAVAPLPQEPTRNPFASGQAPETRVVPAHALPCPCPRPHRSRWSSRTSPCSWSHWPNIACGRLALISGDCARSRLIARGEVSSAWSAGCAP